jgi:soluble lytic murein transglycosylase-like protein
LPTTPKTLADYQAHERAYNAGRLKFNYSNAYVWALSDIKAREYGIHPRLLRGLIIQESGFNAKGQKHSPAGAIGIMQLMPRTAASLGVNPYNPYRNLDGGVRYLKGLLKHYNGNATKAIAHYNGGGGAVTRPPAETRTYKTRIKQHVADMALREAGLS